MEAPKQPPSSESIVLRLFPLNLVLFPGMTLPLRIFEERYKIMVGECLDYQAPFGVLLIREGTEVGAPATPYRVGTTARITQAERLEGGRFDLVTVGERRFQLLEITQERPFLMGRAQYFVEEEAEPPGELVETARGLLREHLKLLAALRGAWLSLSDAPENGTALSYAIAQSMRVPPLVSQHLLQIPTTKERLERALPLLREQMQLTREELTKRNPYQGPRLN